MVLNDIWLLLSVLKKNIHGGITIKGPESTYLGRWNELSKILGPQINSSIYYHGTLIIIMQTKDMERKLSSLWINLSSDHSIAPTSLNSLVGYIVP